VGRVPRFVVRTAMLCLVLLAGTASALLAAGPGQRDPVIPTPPPTVPLTSTAVSTATLPATTVTTGPVTTTSPTEITTTSTASPVLVFTGHGWGHGIGLSQWGAYGYALHGWNYSRILSHYYTGTSLGTVRGSTVRVLVATGKRVKLGATAPWTVSDGAGAPTAMTAGTPLMLRGGLDVAGVLRTSPLTISSTDPLLVNGRAFRGKLTVISDGKLLQVVDTLGLEAYLKGVVAAEMPQAWPEPALEAQAVAARTYALFNLQKGQPFDLYADGRSQVYGGVADETPSTDAAVVATRGQVVLWNGQVADTVYSSTSGGRTASALAALGRDIPYLVSVADPYDNLSPLHNWGPMLVSGASAARDLKLTPPVQDLQMTPSTDGRVGSLTATDLAAAQVTVSGAQARDVLDLPSTWFAASVVSLLPRSQAVPFGTAVTLTGFVHPADDVSASGVSLEAKSLGTGWTPAGAVTLDSTGAFSASESPALSTQYRLAWGSARVGLAKIAVTTVVTAALTGGAIAGSVLPALAGAAVELQLQSGTTWTTVSSTVTGTDGTWSFAGALQPGTYRVRCAPGGGLAPGLSPPVVVA
jgi:stage II sporulation protein D